MAFGIGKIDLVTKTPMEYLGNISREIGIELYIKRDDLTGIGAGGNKLRKLEYLVFDALEKGSTMLLTVGGPQTNHGRLTAAVAAKYGLKSAIVAVGDYPGELSANMLLDRIMGCDLILKKDDGRRQDLQLDEAVTKVTEEYTARGEKVYFIPIGGSNELGALGYYDCAVEIAEQARDMGLENARIVDSVGSMGTYMGLYCGIKNENADLRLTGISIMPFGRYSEKRILEYLDEMKYAYGMSFAGDGSDMDIQKEYTRGGYNNVSKPVRDAIRFVAQKEAILLDPCYTGKGFSGLLEMVKKGDIAKGEKVIFLHTGGFPGLYTPHHRVEFEKELADGVRILE